jgi:hypothetical protein
MWKLDLLLNPGPLSDLLIFFHYLELLILLNCTIPLIDYFKQKQAKEDLINPKNDSERIVAKFFDAIYKLPQFLLKIILFIRRIIIEPTFSYRLVYSAVLIQKDWYAIYQNQELLNDSNHDALIINIYSKIAPSLSIGCGIFLLIEALKNRNQPFKIYFCKSKTQFFDIINNPKTTRVWIFSHGDRGGVSCADGYFLYSDLVNQLKHEAKQKEAIYQFHCNPGYKSSLVQLLSVKSGFVNHRLNDPSGIRVYIEEIINKERWNDLIILE